MDRGYEDQCSGRDHESEYKGCNLKKARRQIEE